MFGAKLRCQKCNQYTTDRCICGLTGDERDELRKLQEEQRSNALGDRPHGMAADKLARLIELTAKARKSAA